MPKTPSCFQRRPKRTKPPPAQCRPIQSSEILERCSPSANLLQLVPGSYVRNYARCDRQHWVGEGSGPLKSAQPLNRNPLGACKEDAACLQIASQTVAITVSEPSTSLAAAAQTPSIFVTERAIFLYLNCLKAEIAQCLFVAVERCECGSPFGTEFEHVGAQFKHFLVGTLSSRIHIKPFVLILSPQQKGSFFACSR